MTKQRASRNLRRREALKGLGALAVSAPSVTLFGCGEPRSSEAAGPSLTSDAGAPADSAGGEGSRPMAAASPTAESTAAPAPAGAPSATHSAGGGSIAAGSGGGAGAGAGGVPSPAAGQAGATTRDGAAGAAPARAPGDFMPVSFEDVASCTLTPTDPAGEGPFFIHNSEVMNDTELVRSDMREGKPGVELQLNLRLLDSDGKCQMPISGVEVYTWHTDATGFYSGFDGQNPDMPYSGSIERTVQNMDRFCRGVQVSDSQGIVRFKTVYPGWYNGRAIHIHFVALRPGSGPETSNYRGNKYMIFTTQMYFAEQFSRMIHENNMPYQARASGAAYEKYVKPQNTTVNPTARMLGGVVVAALNVVTSATGSRR